MHFLLMECQPGLFPPFFPHFMFTKLKEGYNVDDAFLGVAKTTLAIEHTHDM